MNRYILKRKFLVCFCSVLIIGHVASVFVFIFAACLFVDIVMLMFWKRIFICCNLYLLQNRASRHSVISVLVILLWVLLILLY